MEAGLMVTGETVATSPGKETMEKQGKRKKGKMKNA